MEDKTNEGGVKISKKMHPETQLEESDLELTEDTSTEEEDNVNEKLVEEEDNINKELFEKKDVNSLYKCTFEEYLSNGLERKCSKLLKKQDKMINLIEQKFHYINTKMHLLNRKQQSLREKLDKIKKNGDKRFYGEFTIKSMKNNPKLRMFHEINTSYKLQYEEQKQARKMMKALFKENGQQKETSNIQGTHLKHIAADKYTMQDPEVQKEIEVSYQRQCDENLQSVKLLMRIQYESLLKEIECLQKEVPIEDVNGEFHPKSNEQDFQMLNNIPGPFAFKEHYDRRNEILYKKKRELNNLLLQYDSLLTSIKSIQNDVKEMEKIEDEYKENISLYTNVQMKYTINNPIIRKEIEISNRIQRQEQKEAKLYLDNMLTEIKKSSMEKEIQSSKKEQKICDKIVQKKKRENKATIKIQDAQEDTKHLSKTPETDADEIKETLLFMKNAEENVKNPQIVRQMLQKNVLQDVYVAVLENNMKSVYRNVLYKHMICGHKDKYTKELTQIIQQKLTQYVYYHKQLNQKLQKVVIKFLNMERKMDKRHINIMELQNKIKKLEEVLPDDIKEINSNSAQKTRQEEKKNISIMLADAIEMLDNAINEQETLTYGFSKWENEIQDIKKQREEEVEKFVTKMEHLQTESKNLKTELDNIKSQINKQNKCQINKSKLSTINQIDKEIYSWKKFYKKSQEIVAKVTGDNQDTKLEMTNLSSLNSTNLKIKTMITTIDKTFEPIKQLLNYENTTHNFEENSPKKVLS